MKNIFLIFISISALTCCFDSIPLESPSIYYSENVIMFDNWNSIKLIKDPLVISKVKIEKDSLIISVEYSGGCAKHDFKLFIGKWLLKSNPPQAELFLSHDSHGDMCLAWISRDLKFDLTLLKNWFSANMNLKGELILRIYSPGKSEPFSPLLSYYL